MSARIARHCATGSCLCGTIRFVIEGKLDDVLVCHCLVCRRSTTSPAAFSRCNTANLVLLSGRPKWFRSSPAARRGFCGKCGSTLFWEKTGSDHVSISAGALDQPTGLRVVEHIFTEQIADYDQPEVTVLL